MASDDSIPAFSYAEDDALYYAGDSLPAQAEQGPRLPRWWLGKWPAGGIKTKEDLVPYLRERRNDLCWIYGWEDAGVREIHAALARQAVENVHNALEGLGAARPPRPASEQLAHSSEIKTALTALLDAIDPDWGKCDFDTGEEACPSEVPSDAPLTDVDEHEEADTPVNGEPAHSSITVALGELYVLRSETGKEASIPPDYTRLFGCFVQKISGNVPSEYVIWKCLSESLHEPPGSNDTKASPAVRKAVQNLRAFLLRELGPPPDGRRWLITAKKIGLHLNTSVAWKLSKQLRKTFGGRSSVWTVGIDQHIMASSTPNRDQRLPSRSRHDHRDRYENAQDE